MKENKANINLKVISRLRSEMKFANLFTHSREDGLVPPLAIPNVGSQIVFGEFSDLFGVF